MFTYMTRKELIEKIKYGDDIMFDVCGKHFVIFTWDADEKGIYISEVDPVDCEEYFQTIEDLLNGYFIDGHSLGDVAEEIVIRDYTLASDSPVCAEN